MATLLTENKELKLQIISLQTQVDQLRRGIFGRKSERFVWSPNQLSLFPDLYKNEPEEKQQTKTVIVPAHKRKIKKKHPGRNLLENCGHLDVVEEHIDTPHGPEDTLIGYLERFKLGYIPGKFFVKKLITPKYKVAATGKIVTGEQPVEPIPKCEADVSLLSYITVSKFVDHLPEYRLQQIFKRDGVNIPPSTMNGWTHKIADLFRPMASHIQNKILQCGYIQMDESTIKVLKTKKGKAHLGYMWVIYSPAMRCVCFIYHSGRGKEAPAMILKDYHGKLQCDGYQVYEAICREFPHIELSNCNTHARRNFEKAIKNNKTLSSKILLLYQQLYAIERKINDKRGEFDHLIDFYTFRKEERQAMQPIIATLKKLIDNPPPSVLPKSDIAKAILYVRNRWVQLTAFLYDGQLEMDTNFIENCIRPLALGRKNYLFAGSHDAAVNIGVFYTILNTCKHLEINVKEYVEWYLCKINTISIKDIDTLSPFAYKKINS